jgi:hypothetical protein
MKVFRTREKLVAPGAITLLLYAATQIIAITIIPSLVLSIYRLYISEQSAE